MAYLKGNPHIPKAHSYGFSGNYNIFVLQLLDKSLEDIFNERQKFSLKTGAMLAYQMIEVLKYIHSKHIIHRDIKPDNFVLGSDEYNAYLYLVDFGLAKKYRSSKTLKQNPYLKKKKLTGTARYASIHAMEEMEQSRRDDLEAVSYVIMYFIRGNLPWQGMRLKSNEDRYQKILEKKKEITTEELCFEYPKVFYEFVKYAKGLKYSEEPKYDELKKSFVDWLVNQKKEKFDFIYDWTNKEDIKIRDNENNFIEDDLYDSDDNFDDDYCNFENEKKKDEVVTNGNNISLYKTIMTEGNGKTNHNSNNNINVIIENKKCVGNFSSRCCIMYNIILFNILVSDKSKFLYCHFSRIAIIIK